MRKYRFVFASGRITEIDAEGDDTKTVPGMILLWKKKEFGGPIARSDEKADIVRFISAHQIEEYGYVELNA